MGQQSKITLLISQQILIQHYQIYTLILPTEKHDFKKNYIKIDHDDPSVIVLQKKIIYTNN